jgi:RNA polymerase sigma factor (TIGR02999 family)
MNAKLAPWQAGHHVEGREGMSQTKSARFASVCAKKILAFVSCVSLMWYPLFSHCLMYGSLSLTEQLRRFSSGDRNIADAVFREVLPKLREVAVRQLQRERYAAPYCPSELINEAWLKSLRNGGWHIRDREHFYAIAGLVMRQVLVDAARKRLAQRRGYGEGTVSLDDLPENIHASTRSDEQVVEIGLLLEKLDRKAPEVARIVDLHYLVGFSLEEIAGITGLTFRQVRHRWEKGQNWLKDRVAG